MRVISYGNSYEIYENDLKTYDKLPAGTYKVAFNPMAGFSLRLMDDFIAIEEKVYGSHDVKLDKVVSTFESFQRSLGVILSGDKGIGKSLFVQMLAERMVQKGVPVVVVDKAFPGVAAFLESIDQEILVLFDEFEKVFSDREGIESQDALLGLFDGTSQKKRLYAITVNKVYRVNEYMINRPGRFHYHFRFDYPQAAEITTYLQDKIAEEYYGEIDRVVAFSVRVPLNFDCLRAIAFELAQGLSFEDAIADLNILNTETPRFDVEFHFADGLPSLVEYNEELDLFRDRVFTCVRPNEGTVRIDVHFDPKKLVTSEGTLVLDGRFADVDTYGDSDNKYYDATITKLIIKQRPMKQLHYGAF